MSQPAPKRTAVPPAPPQAAFADRTGRFRRAGATLLPPAGALALADVMSPEEIGAELEPDTTVAPERGITSGVFGRSAGSATVPDAELAGLADSLMPYYREADRGSERAELAVEDLSLRLDNPYSASSLVPPPQTLRALPLRAVLGVGLGVAAAAGLIAFGWSRSGAIDPVRAARLQPVAAASVQRHEATVPVAAAVVVPVPREEPAAVAAAVAAPQTTATPAPAAQPAQTPTIAAPAVQPKVEVQAAVEVPAKMEPAVVVTAAAEPAVAETAAAETTEAQLEAPGAEIALPEIPSRAEVSAGFEAVRGALETCAAGKHGVVDIDATVSGAGRVTYALVAGVFKGSPEGSCMARAVRTARFPQFSRASLKVSYPVAL